jgi:uncharacterized repeat protein (TIGR04138 family)
MPPSHEGPSQQAARAKSIDEAIVEQGLYPLEAFEFVRRGLSYTVERIHSEPREPGASRHVSGRQLCEGLRDLAHAQWGMVARAVLSKWNVRRSEDFGKIVFTLVELGELSKTDEDTVEDFKGVFDFAKAFDGTYVIEGAAVRKALETNRP